MKSTTYKTTAAPLLAIGTVTFCTEIKETPVNRLTEPGSALAEARSLAGEVCSNGPLAVAVSKQVIVESASWSEAEMFERQRPLVQKVLESNDAREGASAFAQKRPPVWTGT